MNRIKELRTSKGIKQVDLAVAISVSQAALFGYETGKYEPDIDTLRKISDFFCVSVDCLIGLSDEIAENVKTRNINEDDLKAAFWGGDKELSKEDLDDMWADVKNFASFVAEKKKREKEK